MTSNNNKNINYTLIFEDKEENTKTIDIQFILEVFNQIKINLPTIKKYDYKITLLKNDGNISEYLSKPKNTNILIQMVKDYYKFIDDKLALIRTPNKDEVLLFNTGNSDWFDTNIFESLKRPCNKTTKLFIVKKKDLIEVSKKHTLLGIYKLKNKNGTQCIESLCYEVSDKVETIHSLLEVISTLYSEEQVREALKYGVDNSEIIKRGCKNIEGFIQSLKQPKKD